MGPIYQPVPDHPYLVRKDLALTETEMLVLVTMLYNMRPVGYLFGDYTEAGADLSTFEWTRVIYTLIGAQIFNRPNPLEPARIEIDLDNPERMIIHESAIAELADDLPDFSDIAHADAAQYLHGPFS